MTRRLMGVLLTFSLLLLSSCGDGPKFGLSDFNESFEAVTYNNKVDILWVIDTSPSMTDDRQKLSNEIEFMFEQMASKKLDYRMAAVTMDMGSSSDAQYSGGRFVGASSKVISNNTSNKVSAFKSMLNGYDTTYQYADGLDALKKALSVERLAKENQGFFRDDSLLSVVFVSDGRDWSSETPESIISFLDSLKPNLENGNKGWVANFIGVLEESVKCETIVGVSEIGVRFMEVSNASNGSVNSICEDELASTVANIQRTIISIVTDWYLEEPAVVDTIRVTINGVVILQDSENGWTYNAEKKLISFHGTAVPASDAKVVVDYTPESIGKKD
ncbi:MAG: hypothetical protein VX642_06390 [Bdellovibrionota bacterium]|nr:hypothetical protein [Bdellovibrionota bacterium]